MGAALKTAVGLNSPENASTTSVPPMPPANSKPANKPTLMSSTLSTNSGMNALKGGRRKRKSSRKTKKRSKRSKRSKTSRRRN